MSDKPKPSAKRKNGAKAPHPSLKLTLPPLYRVITTPLEEPSTQPETDSITVSNTAPAVVAEAADAPVVSTPPPASAAVNPAPQEPKDDIEITPRPATPPAASKTTAASTRNGRVMELTESEDSEDEASPTPVRKKAKPATKNSKASAHKDDEKILRIVLLIPQASGGSDKRKTLTSTDSFEDALETIHQTIGCADVKRKPALAYKLSDASQRASSINLDNEDDWVGLCEEVVDRQRKKKTTIAVSINVPLDYMESLRARAAKDGKNKSQQRGNSKKLGKKLVLMDLDDDEDDDDGGDGSIPEKEAKYEQQLKAALTRCQRCGDSKWCCISRTGEHVNLTFQQRRGWISALALGLHGVTLKTPPKSDLFQDFYGSSKSRTDDTTLPASAAPNTPVHPMLMHPQAAMAPYGMMPSPWQYMGPAAMAAYANGHFPGFPITPQVHPPPIPHPLATPPRRAEKHDLPSSDPPEGAFHEPYTSIATFLERLHIDHPKRRLDTFIHHFDALDYYQIDDLGEVTRENLMDEPFCMSKGNAEFFLRQVEKEMKRINDIRVKDRLKAKRVRF